MTKKRNSADDHIEKDPGVSFISKKSKVNRKGNDGSIFMLRPDFA